MFKRTRAHPRERLRKRRGILAIAAIVVVAVGGAVVLFGGLPSGKPVGLPHAASAAATESEGLASTSLVPTTPTGVGYSISIPEGWTYEASSYPSDHTTNLWVDASATADRVEVLASGCAGCASTGSAATTPAPEAVVPSGAANVTSVSECEVTYTDAAYGGDDLASNSSGSSSVAPVADPLSDIGMVLVTNQGGRVDGYFRIDVWLPPSQESLANQILASFSAGANEATC